MELPRGKPSDFLKGMGDSLYSQVHRYCYLLEAHCEFNHDDSKERNPIDLIRTLSNLEIPTIKAREVLGIALRAGRITTIEIGGHHIGNDITHVQFRSRPSSQTCIKQCL